MSAKFRPPYSRMMIRFESCTASITSCVTNSTVFFDRSQIDCSSSRSFRAVMASR